MPFLLLLLFSTALSIGVGSIVVLVRRARESRGSGKASPCDYERHCLFRRPNCWLAVRSRNPLAVQSALGLHNGKPCSWTDALAGEEKLFISPPVKGWIVVFGSGLPDPSDDVDACYRFLTHLSHRLGQVQFFSASRVVHHHAWVKADGGKIVRAFAWGGVTLWQQGARTTAEKELGLRSFDYDEIPERASFHQPDVLSLNTERVPMLAARWSVDPGRLPESSLQYESGIAGEPSRRF